MKMKTQALPRICLKWTPTRSQLSAGRSDYLFNNPLLKKPLAHIKPRLLGHGGGTTPGLNFIYVHLNCIIKEYNLNVLNITGGHGGTGQTTAL